MELQKLGETIVLQLGDYLFATRPTSPKLPLLFPKTTISSIPDNLFEDSQLASQVLTYQRTLAARESDVDASKNLAAIHVYDNPDLAKRLLMEFYFKHDIDVLHTADMRGTHSKTFFDYLLVDSPRRDLGIDKQLIRAETRLPTLPTDFAPCYVWEGTMDKLMQLKSSLNSSELIQYDRIFLGAASIATGVPFCCWRVHTGALTKTLNPPEEMSLLESIGFWFFGRPQIASDILVRFFELCAKSAARIIMAKEMGRFRFDLVNVRGEHYDKYFSCPTSYRGWESEVM